MRRKQNLVCRRGTRRRLILEALEGRRLLVGTDLAAITGRVYDDFSGNGFNPGEEVAGATLALYRDNGDGTFQQGSDTQVTTTTSGSDGRYSFSRLTAANYFVLQDAQTVAGKTLVRTVSPLIAISSQAVEGTVVRVIDDFDRTSQAVSDSTNDGVPVTSSVSAPEAIGGERDLFVNKTSANGSVQLSVNNPLLPKVLIFDSAATGNGERRVTWDGPDGNASVVDDNGLGGVNLTSPGDALGLQLQIGADLAGGNAVVRLYTNDGNAGTANRFSTATLPIPQTGGEVPFLAEFLPFSQFTATGGGGADLTSIGAIELEITGSANVNGSAELVGSVGQTLFVQDFANFDSADLRLSKTINDDTPSIGQNVTFTVTLNNDGPDTATNVAVRDRLPQGVTFVSSSPSQGTFNNSTGIWTVGSVASAASATLTVVVRIDSAGNKSNFAEVSASDQFDPDSTPDPDDTSPNDTSEDDQALVTFVVTALIDLSLTKSATPTSVVVGQNVTYTLDLRNAGPDNATGVSVREQLPAGVSVVSATASQGSYNSTTGIWTVGSVNNGAQPRLTLVARVDTAGTKTNTAEVIAADQPDSNSTPNNNNPDENDQDSVTIEAPQIDLSLMKTANPTTVVVGQNVTFTVNLANAGPSQATGVAVQDQLPSGITFVSATPSQGTYNSSTGIWTVGSVAAGATPTLSIVGRVTVPGTKTNTAQVSAADQPDIDSTPGNNVPEEDDQDSVTIEAPQIDLSLVKTVDKAMPDVGQNVVFTLRLDNAGPSNATGVSVRDQLPVGLQFVSASTAAGSYNQATGIWTVGAMAASSNAVLTITATATQAQMLTNTAEVFTADQPDIDSTPNNNIPEEDDQDSVTVGAQQIDLSLIKTVDDARPNVGDTIAFQIVVSNAGPSSATGVVVQDKLPATLTFVSSTASVGSYNAATGQWTIGNMAPNLQSTLTIRARVDGAAQAINVAEVIMASPGDVDSTPGNGDPDEDDQDSVVVTPQVADLSLRKTADNDKPNVGQNVSFNLTLNNSGPDTATNVTVRDLLPSGISFVSSTPSQGTYDAATGLWSVGSLNNAGQATLLIVGKIANTGTKTNTAQVTASDQFDPNSTPGNNIEAEDDQESVTITPPVIDLSLDKSIDVPRPIVGQTIRYTIAVNNAGPNNATGIVVLDELPDGVTFVSSTATSGNYNPLNGLWNLGNLAAGATATLLIDATVRATVPTTNFAEVFAANEFDPDSVPGNGSTNEDDDDSVTFTPAVADLSLTKSVDKANPNVGTNVMFTIEVSNAGPDPATNVTVLDQLPPGLDFVSATPGVGTYVASTGIWTVGNVAVNSKAKLTLVAKSTTAQIVSNTAQVQTSDQLDPDSTPGNNVPTEDDQDSVTVEGQQIDLELSKVVDEDRPNVGDQIRFTIRVDNQGPSNASGVSVRDVLPAGFTFQSSDASQGGYNAASGIWNVGSIAPEDFATLDIFVTVDRILSVTNIAEVIAADQPDVDSTPNNGIASEDDQDSVTVITQVADLSLTKTASNARPNVGENVTFTLDLRNSGPDAATNIRVLDKLPQGVTFVSSTPSVGVYDPQTGFWTLPELASRTNATLQIVAVVDRIGKTTNVAEVDAVDQADPNSTPGNGVPLEDDQDSVTIDPPVIDLELAKTADPLRPRVGGPLTYIVVLRNEGPDRATGIVVQDQLPAGVTFVSATPSVGQFNPLTGNWTVDALAAGSTATLRLLTTVNAPGEPENRAQVLEADQFDSDSTPGNDDGIDGNGNDEDDQASITVETASADLSLTKTIDDDRPGVGRNVLFSLRIFSSGPDDAADVVVRDLLPPGMTFISSKASLGSYDPTSGRWSIPKMVTGKAETLEIVARVNTFGDRVNTAEIIASNQFDPDSTPNNNNPEEDDQSSVMFTPELVDLALAKFVDDPTPNVGQTVRYSVFVDNAGPSVATQVTVTDRIPQGLTIVGVNASRGVYDPATGIWNVGSVDIRSRERLDIDVRVETPQPKTNTAEVTSARQPDVDSTPGNGVPTEDDFGQVVITPQRADLELTKSVNNPTPNRDDELIFTLVVTNKGPNNATNVVVRDLLPRGVDFLRSTVTIGEYDPETGIWTIPTVANGSAQSLQLIATLDSKLPVKNEAEIIASDQFDPDSTPDNQVPTEDDIDDVTVTPKLIDISVSASISKEEPNLGEEFKMFFRVSNSGPFGATGVRASVTLPEGLRLVDARPGRGVFVNGVWEIGSVGVGETVQLTLTARAETRGTKQVPFEVIAHQQYDRDSDPGNNNPKEDDQTTLLVRVPLYSKRLFLAR